MAILSSFNPSCYLPSSVNNYMPKAIACPPPPSIAKSFFDTITSPFTSTYTTLFHTTNAIVGLPSLSLLLIPTMTSYSTTLNLLFFYLTWSTLVLSHDALKVEVVASLAVRFMFYVFPSTLMLLVDLLFPGISSSFKSLGEDALPLKDTKRKTVFKFAKVVCWSVFNVILGVLMQGFVEWVLVSQLGQASVLRVTTTLPSPWVLVKDIVKGLVVRDALTWAIHRYALHSGDRPANAIVRDLSLLHAGWSHKSVTVPFPLSPTYDHPLVYMLKSFLPMYLPAYLWGFHALTFIVYLAIISLEETFTHSGYAKLPTHFILGGIASRNEVHCLTKGKGSFGTWGLCDWLAGTTVGNDAMDDLAGEVDEAGVQERIVSSATKRVSQVRRAAAGHSGTANVGKSRRRTRHSKADSDSE